MKYWLVIVLVVTAVVIYSRLPDADVAHAMDVVRSHLKDPNSAEFRWVEPCPSNPGMMHGEVNAKSGLGTLTGFTSFYTFGNQAHVGPVWDQMEWEGRSYSVADQLSLACFKGGDPDVRHFRVLVAGGSLD